MKFIDCLQGSDEWMAARCGLITASRFADAISTTGGLTDQQAMFVKLVLEGRSEKEAAAAAGYKTAPRATSIVKALAGENPAEPSDTARRYASDLVIERISGKPFGIPPSTWLLERGHQLERLARMAYEEKHTSFVTESGICIDDSGFAYSSDGLVDEDGLIEIKCPIDGNKILTMWKTGDVSEYIHQMQGGMWISGRKWCDFIMYVPDLAPVGKDLFVKRIMRDDKFIDDMVVELARFDAMVVDLFDTLCDKQEAPSDNFQLVAAE